ncbi:gliding motility-associated C-terminal domain-containing protein, partial [Flavobacterium sp. HBTb2-11-1]|uniref:gliding motility-associated C-terminal domain-containing protein n=1 Tax=Flavobacterium sp. HBTb2-11-1 TaxID=2692212 RepID=UPI00136D4B59
VVHPGGCDNTYTTTVTVNPDPVVNITNPNAVCDGTTVDLSAPAVTAGSAANLTYTYFTDADATVALVNYTAVTAEGTYYIRGENANGCYSVMPVVVTVNPLPTASVVAAGPVCQGDTSPVVTFTGADGTAPYTFTYNINGGNNLTVSTVSGNSVNVPVSTAAAGSFVYTLVSVADSSSTACTQSQNGFTTAIVNPLPTASISGTAEVCHNGTAPAVTFTGANGTAPYTFTYKINGGDDQTVTTTAGNSAAVDAPTDTVGTFTYTLVSVKDDSSTACEQAQTGSAAITVKVLPTAVISGAAEVCKNGASPLVTFTGDNGTAPYTFKYTVNGGAEQSITTISGSSVTVAAPTNVAGDLEYALISVRESSSCEQLQTGSVIIKVNDLPTATISGSDSVCQNEPNPDITFRASGGSAPYTFTYKINGGADQTISTAGGSTATVSVPTGTAGTYVYSLVSVTEGSTNACGQLQTGFATVTVNAAPTVAITNPAAVCSGESVNLTAAAVTAGSTANLTYAYFTDALGTAVLANPSAVTADGTYYIQGTTASGCSSAISPVIVTVNPTPTVVITNPAAVCSGTSVDLTAAAVTDGSTAGLTFTYFTDAAAVNALAAPSAVTLGGDYYIKGSTPQGCYDIEKVTVTVNPTPTVVITNPAAACSGTPVDLTAAAVTDGSTSGLTFTYFTDAAGLNPISDSDAAAITSAGDYYIKGTTAEGCFDIEKVTVTFNSIPSVVITDPAAVCSGASVDLTADAVTAGSTANLTYTYFTDALGTAVLANPSGVTADGTYYIQGTTASGCKSAIEPVIVTVNLMPTVVITNPAAVCSGTPVDLTAAAVTDGSTAGLTFAYFTDAAGTAILNNPDAVTAAGDYYIIGTTPEGCSSAPEKVTVAVNALLALSGTESTACAADGSGYVLSFTVTGQAPYAATGTGAPGTWNGNEWTSDKILAGTDYNVSVQDANACNTITVSDTAPICCVYEVTAPTFPATIITCYNQMPAATSLTEAEFEALGNGDGKIGAIPCGVIEITASNSAEPSCNGNVTRTYTVTEYADPNNNKVRDAGEDMVLNTTSVTQTFTLERADFAMPADQGATVACASEVIAPIVPTVIDNCGNVLTPSAPAISAVPSCNGVETYTYTFTDCVGHKHDWVYTYTIDNTVAPQGTAPANLTVQCIGDIPVASINAVTNLSSNCNSSVTVTVADTNNGGSGCSSSPYIVTRTYTLTDCGGLKTELVQTITAIDTAKPAFVGALPANITVECSAAVPAPAILTATDNCSAATVSFNEERINGGCSGNYQLIRTWTASDACGNQTVHTQTVTVADTTAPVFVETLPAAEVNADCNTIPEPAVLTATDGCGMATVNYTESKIEGDCSARYTLERTWTAVDECGNQASFTQKINVSCLPNIYNALSPNGDGINDTFVIDGIDCFPDNTVTIYNRYGVKIYEKKGYDNVTNPFEGFSDGRATVIRGDKLPTGTYFYTLEYNDNGKQVSRSGYLYINNQ